MMRRKRLLAGTFALMALTFSFAESVWASTCGSAPMDTAAAPVVGEAPLPDDCMPPIGGGGESSEEPGSECPFGPAVTAQGCAGIASLPTHSALTPSPSPEHGTSVFSEERQRDLLSADVLFHPPRP